MTTTSANPLVSERFGRADVHAAHQLYELGLIGGRRPNAVKLLPALQSLAEAQASLYVSMFTFAFDTAGYDLDNPLEGDLLTRYKRNLKGWSLITPVVGVEMYSMFQDAIAETARLQSLLDVAGPDQLELYVDAMYHAYEEGRPDKSTTAEIIVSTAALASTDVSSFVNPEDEWVVEGDFGYLTSCKTQSEAMSHAQQEVEEQKRLGGVEVSIILNA